MRQLLLAYNQPLLFVDADSYFTEHPEPLFARNENLDVGLNHNVAAWAPWRQFSATQVYVDASRGGVLFARYLRNLFLNIYAPGSPHNFWIDQGILAHAFETSRVVGDRIRFGDNRATRWSGAVHHK
jgi:hypothetical protein